MHNVGRATFEAEAGGEYTSLSRPENVEKHVLVANTS